jgi:alpha-1,3-rhamnosyl/mannosyltransferase
MAAIRAAEAAGWVRFVEAPSDDALEALYQSATLAVYPSWYEGFGLPVVEAMARGVPVVASEIAALAETGGPAARYADPFRIESLAGAIVGLIEDADERSRLGQAGRERAATYSWQATAARTRRAYDLARGG